MLEVTYEGNDQAKETKINMLLDDYELFSMKENKSISNILDQFATIINGLASLRKLIMIR